MNDKWQFSKEKVHELLLVKTQHHLALCTLGAIELRQATQLVQIF